MSFGMGLDTVDSTWQIWRIALEQDFSRRIISVRRSFSAENMYAISLGWRHCNINYGDEFKGTDFDRRDAGWTDAPESR